MKLFWNLNTSQDAPNPVLKKKSRRSQNGDVNYDNLNLKRIVIIILVKINFSSTIYPNQTYAKKKVLTPKTYWGRSLQAKNMSIGKNKLTKHGNEVYKLSIVIVSE